MIKKLKKMLQEGQVFRVTFDKPYTPFIKRRGGEVALLLPLNGAIIRRSRIQFRDLSNITETITVFVNDVDENSTLYVVEVDEEKETALSAIRHSGKGLSWLKEYLRDDFLRELDEQSRDSLHIFAICFYLALDEGTITLATNVTKAIESDRRIREANFGQEMTLLTQILSAQGQDPQLVVREIKYHIADRKEIKMQEIRALIDVVLRVAVEERVHSIAVARTEAQAETARKFLDRVGIITPHRIAELLDVDEKTASRIKNTIVGLAGKKLIARFDSPIRRGESELRGFAITPLLEYGFSPLIMGKKGGGEFEVRVFYIHPLLLQTKSFSPLPLGAFSRIMEAKIPPRFQEFVADLYIYLLNHRHDNIAHVRPDSAMPSYWTRSRHRRELETRIEKALEVLRRQGLVVGYDRRETGWRVELW